MKDYNRNDIIVCIYICILLAFRDYSKLIIISSILVFIWFMSLKANRFIIEYTIYKIAFIFLCMSSSLWSINPFVLKLSFSMCFRLITNLLVLLYINNEKKFIKLIKFIIYGSILLCIRMLLVVPSDAWGNSRVGLYLSHDVENTYGNTGITYVLGVASALLLIDENRIIKNTKVKYFLIVIFNIFSLMSGSKKQVFILLIVIIVKFVSNIKSYKSFLKNTIFVLFITLVMFYFIYTIPKIYNIIGYRLEAFIYNIFTNEAKTEDLSTITRIQFIKDAYNVFIENPFLGVGIDSFKYYNSVQFTWAENNFLELMADLGMLGVFVYYLPHLKIIKSLFIQYKRKRNFFRMNFIFFLVLVFIDLTMVSYNELHLQFYLAILYGYFVICMKKRY